MIKVQFEIIDIKQKKSNAKKLLVGMDEAGRGPVLGPLIIGLCIVSKNQVQILKKIGVMDSKTLSAKRREKLYSEIIESINGYGILKISAEEIDSLRTSGKTLNEIEIMGFKYLLTRFSFSQSIELQLDAADVNAERFGRNFEEIVNGSIDSRHKGDSIFPAVSAASILAKVTRDQNMVRLQEEIVEFDPSLPQVGSGYPNKISKNFLKEYYKKYKIFPNFTRESWDTTQKLLQEIKGKKTSLEEYF